jgi:hypothetical protein
VKRNDLLKKAFAGVVCCLLLAATGYSQSLEKGDMEVTGQVGIVTGINTHASFAASAGKAVTDKVFVLGEFSYIPLGGAEASGSGFEFSAGGRVVTFMGGAQYQFGERKSFIPYAGGALGVVHSSFESTVNGTTLDVSNNDFYVSLSGGARYYVKDRWGFKPELTLFAGTDSFWRFAVGMFYRFGR